MTDYDAWSRRIEAGDVQVVPGSVIYADEDPDGGLRLLLDAAGATSFEEVVRVAIGRPHAGEEKGTSPVLRARVPREVRDGVRRLARRQHSTESQIVREAVVAYLDAQHLVASDLPVGS